MSGSSPDILTLAAQVRAGRTSAAEVLEETLGLIFQRDPELNCFTALYLDEARRQARETGAQGLLAGVPFGVKNLFDVAGEVTLAGSKIRRQAPPATRDATLVRRLKAEGAILVGTLNMDEFAYGFSTENAHYGATRNPHDLERIVGGSSGGSAAAVAGGLLPVALGSDTNGSIRVPAALCGVFGLKPTFGRLSRQGVYPFVASLDHAGHFARTARDLAVVYDVMQGADEDDPSCCHRDADPSLEELDQSIDGLKVGVLEGWFQDGAMEDVLEGLAQTVSALKGARSVRLAQADRARAAAFCITAAESAAFHLEDLKRRPDDFDHATRDRLLAGALLPAQTVLKAEQFRTWFRAYVASVFDEFDVLLAPTTFCSAPKIGQTTTLFRGHHTSIRANLGIFTQPLSFIGLPIVAAPVRRPGLPVGVQIVTRPWAEAMGLRVAHQLERSGVLGAAISE